MSGLFTLNSESLGKLDANALGGFGTGFIAAQSSSTGTVAGKQGFTGSVTTSSLSTGTVTGSLGLSGSVTGSVTISGSATGSVAFAGIVLGVSTSTGSVVGVENDRGVIAGTSTSTGSVLGIAARSGSVTGATGSNGSGNGAPHFIGTAIGVNTSTGSASGSPDTPPTPTPETVTGHAPLSQYIPIRQPRRLRQQQPVPTMHSGVAQGNTEAIASLVGSCGYAGKVTGSQTVLGRCSGLRYPSDELMARWARQTQEHELLLVGLL
jgi:hypothetical protein